MEEKELIRNNPVRLGAGVLPEEEASDQKAAKPTCRNGGLVTGRRLDKAGRQIGFRR